MFHYLAIGLLDSMQVNDESKVILMLGWAFLFFLLAIVAGIFGFLGIASALAGIAKVLFVIFVVLFIASLFLGRRRTQ